MGSRQYNNFNSETKKLGIFLKKYICVAFSPFGIVFSISVQNYPT
jgi:hypothetical protein